MDGNVYQRINVTSVRNVALGDRWDGDVKISGNTILVTTMRDGPADTSGWTPAFGQSLSDALGVGGAEGRLDIGCIAAHGYFSLNQETNAYETFAGGKPATAFLFKLISQLQFSGTVPMIDVQAYAQWLSR
jgi:hypothetical protein